jgi:SAM-dependent methyltransferase
MECAGCQRKFPLVNGVVRFVDKQHYARSFGFQWLKHDRTQLDTESSRRSEADFIRRTGLKPEDLAGKLVLDVGCGMGRYAEVASRWGARVVGIDLSQAVEAAAHNLADRDVLPGGRVFATLCARELRLHLQSGRAPPHSQLRKSV